MSNKRRSRPMDPTIGTGLWAIEPRRGRAVFKHLQSNAFDGLHDLDSMDCHERITITKPSGDLAYIAVIYIAGPTTKAPMFGWESSIPDLIFRVNMAAEDDLVDAILFVIDSPGGTVAGTADLAAAVRNASKWKPTFAQIEDCCCSAAYWVASQADMVYANDRTAIVGSIGTYMGLMDDSEYYANIGIRPLLITTGEHKGAGFPGTEITDSHLAEFQKIIDETQKSFAEAVQTGREMSATQLDPLADGRVWLADEARRLRLIDGIQSTDDTLHELAGLVDGRPQKPVQPKRNPSPSKLLGKADRGYAGGTRSTRMDQVIPRRSQDPGALPGPKNPPKLSEKAKESRRRRIEKLNYRPPPRMEDYDDFEEFD